MTGIGPVAVRQPRVRDREAGADDPARIRFTRQSYRPTPGVRRACQEPSWVGLIDGVDAPS